MPVSQLHGARLLPGPGLCACRGMSVLGNTSAHCPPGILERRRPGRTPGRALLWTLPSQCHLLSLYSIHFLLYFSLINKFTTYNVSVLENTFKFRKTTKWKPVTQDLRCQTLGTCLPLSDGCDVHRSAPVRAARRALLPARTRSLAPHEGLV